ncbi:MAG: DUF2177 family protein [Acholeplasmataceae bacterium]|nr:DUF2177 family protein [Acholeplasmataceae bacterium]
MLTFIQLFIIALVVFMAIDLIWLGFVAKNLYQKYLGDFLSPHPNWKAAIVFYVLFIAFLVIFVLLPSVDGSHTLAYAMLYGSLFGFITYATYDLTNLATLKGWPIEITIIDLIWGTFLGFSTSTLTYLLFNLIF